MSNDKWVHDKFELDEQGPRIRSEVNLIKRLDKYRNEQLRNQEFQMNDDKWVHDKYKLEDQGPRIRSEVNLNVRLDIYRNAQAHSQSDIQENRSVVGRKTNKTTDRRATERNASQPSNRQINRDLTNDNKNTSAAERINYMNAPYPQQNDRSRATNMMATGASDGHRSIQTIIDSNGKPSLVSRWKQLS